MGDILRAPPPFRGGFAAPPSKSHAIRLLVAAALADGRSTLRGVAPSAGGDVAGAWRGLASLGVTLRAAGSGAEVVGSSGGRTFAERAALDVGGSGTALRLLAAVASLARGPVTVGGDAQLLARPAGAVVAALRDLGVDVCTAAGGRPPVTVEGGPPTGGGEVVVDASQSSHPLSAMLLLAPCLAGGLVVRAAGVVASRPYVELTVAVMRRFGARVTGDGAAWRVEPTGYRAADSECEGDWSSAAFLLGGAAARGGSVRCEALGAASVQADRAILPLLEDYGAVVGRDGTAVRVAGGARRGIRADLRDAPDLAPIVAAMACRAEGESLVTGAAHLRSKESDRIAASVAAARAVGCAAEERDDGFRIRGPARTRGPVASRGDHRIAMAFAACGFDVDDLACAAKSWPGFAHALASLVS